VPAPADTTANGSTTTTNATDESKLQPSKPCSPEVPTQKDINAIVCATQLLEGQNSVLSQIVYDVIQGRYGKPYQNKLADSLSQSLSSSMVEQARLFNLLKEYVIKTNPKPPTQYYHLLDYQWILGQERGKIKAVNKNFLR
jgi:hypothetical protein